MPTARPSAQLMRQNLSAFCVDGNAVGIAEFKFFAPSAQPWRVPYGRGVCHMAGAVPTAMPSAHAVHSFFFMVLGINST
jgi:hypothetical protein